MTEDESQKGKIRIFGTSGQSVAHTVPILKSDIVLSSASMLMFQSIWMSSLSRLKSYIVALYTSIKFPMYEPAVHLVCHETARFSETPHT